MRQLGRGGCAPLTSMSEFAICRFLGRASGRDGFGSKEISAFGSDRRFAVDRSIDRSMIAKSQLRFLQQTSGGRPRRIRRRKRDNCEMGPKRPIEAEEFVKSSESNRHYAG